MLTRLQHDFQSRILPVVERWARANFKHDDDRVAECVGLAWKWSRRLHDRGRDPAPLASPIARFTVQAVRSGRRVCGQLPAKDVMSSVAQQRHHFYVGKLPDFSTLSENPLSDALIDNTVSPVPDQVVFRCDFPVWRATYDQRRRKIMDALALGHRTKDVAKKFRMSQGRISQLRREFMDDWQRFHGDKNEAA